MLGALATAVAGANGGTDYLQWALDQGGAFLVAVVCAYGWWKAEKRADAERAARDLLASSIMDKFVPAIEKSTAAQSDFIAAAREQSWRARDDR